MTTIATQVRSIEERSVRLDSSWLGLAHAAGCPSTLTLVSFYGNKRNQTPKEALAD